MRAPECTRRRKPSCPNAAVHLCYRSLTIAKTDCAQPGEPAWISGNDPRKVVVDACGPIVRFLPAKYIGSERNAVAKDRDIDLHVIHVAKLLFHVEDLGNGGNVESCRALDDISSSLDESPGKRRAARQMLDIIE